MKRCPNCKRVFSDENSFCLEDGTILENLDSTAENQQPTQVLSGFPTVNSPATKGNNGIYLLVAALSVVILALSMVIYSLIRTTAPDSQNKLSETVYPSNKAPGNEKTAENRNSEVSEVKEENQPISETAVRDLITRWEQAQDSRNFKLYKSLYAPQFFGFKRTKNGGEKRMEYAEWLKDRQKMSKNVIDVEVENLEIKIEGDTADAVFIQRFQSVNYQDAGQKIMKIKMFPDGAKIIYEDLKYAY